MAIAFGSIVDGGNNGGSTNSLTFAFNNVAGNIVLVGIEGDVIGSGDDITSVTYAGAACTLIAKRTTGTGDRNTYMYFRSSPSTGSNNVVINCTANHYLLAVAASYTGCATTGQPDASTTNNGTPPLSTSLTSIADNCWHVLMSGYSGSGGTQTAGAGTTRRSFESAFFTWAWFDSNAAKTPAGSVTLISDSTIDINPDHNHVMASISPFIADNVYNVGLGTVQQAVQRGAVF